MADGRQRSEVLYLLQVTDSAIDSATALLEQVRASIGESEALLAARAAYTDAEAALVTARGQLKELEATSADVSGRAKALEKKLYGGQIAGTKEIATAQHDIAAAKERVIGLDDQSLELMSVVEARTAAHAAAKRAQAQAEATWRTEQAGALAQVEQIEAELGRLQTERAARQAVVTPVDLARYEKIRQQHQGLAVVLLTVPGFTCSKCHVIQSLTRQKELKQALDILTCTNCGRILFWK